MSSTLGQAARKAVGILERVIKTEEIPVPAAAKLLKKTPAWVHENFNIIYHNAKTHSVRLVDIEAYQERRIVRPKPKPESNGKVRIWRARKLAP